MIVGSPDYFARHPAPTTLVELMQHNCITLRMATSGSIYAWDLQHEGRPVQARVRGQGVFSSMGQMICAALSGSGLAFVTEELVSVMPAWCAPLPGLFAYYPSRRHASRALSIVIDTIRYPGPVA